VFQSLVRDSAHSDRGGSDLPAARRTGFNPSFGILLIQTYLRQVCSRDSLGFNPSFGILLIQTEWTEQEEPVVASVSIPRSGFCSFRPPSLLARGESCTCFNPSFGILLIQTRAARRRLVLFPRFQSLVRDSAHSDSRKIPSQSQRKGFNPSFGILLIQTS